MPQWKEHQSQQSAIVLFVRVEKPVALPVFKATDHTLSLHFKKLTETTGTIKENQVCLLLLVTLQQGEHLALRASLFSKR